jgi:hypothetical protein
MAVSSTLPTVAQIRLDIERYKDGLEAIRYLEARSDSAEEADRMFDIALAYTDRLNALHRDLMYAEFALYIDTQLAA